MASLVEKRNSEMFRRVKQNDWLFAQQREASKMRHLIRSVGEDRSESSLLKEENKIAKCILTTRNSTFTANENMIPPYCRHVSEKKIETERIIDFLKMFCDALWTSRTFRNDSDEGAVSVLCTHLTTARQEIMCGTGNVHINGSALVDSLCRLNSLCSPGTVYSIRNTVTNEVSRNSRYVTQHGLKSYIGLRLRAFPDVSIVMLWIHYTASNEELQDMTVELNRLSSAFQSVFKSEV